MSLDEYKRFRAEDEEKIKKLHKSFSIGLITVFFFDESLA